MEESCKFNELLGVVLGELMNMINQLRLLNDTIRAAEKKYHRQADSVALVAVSKKKSASDILAAVDAGQRHFGENYCQEAIDKILAIKGADLVWHFIGYIQANKTRLIAAHFDWVHTVDRVKIARRLNEARPANKLPLNICIQINISGEASKAGIHPAQALDFLLALGEFKHLKVRGLMALPAPVNGPLAQRRQFAELRRCIETLQQSDSNLDTLSMGTSLDMEAAIAEGATMIRVGTALFGKRHAS